MFRKIKDIIRSYIDAFKTIPLAIVILFVLTIISMNILANKTIYQNFYIAIDGGIIITWLAVFLSDLTTTTRGPKATISMSIFGTVINLVFCGILSLIGLIPDVGNSEFFKQVFNGTSFIIISGAIAFILSSTMNATLNYGIGQLFKRNPNGKLAIALRCNVSTLISQIFDNFVFNVLAYILFAPLFWDGFSWTLLQCFTCALLYGAIEVVIEFVLFPLFYRLFKVLKNRFENQKEKN